MQENRWKQTETIFNEAASLPADNRRQHVRQRCAGDEDLYKEICGLLDADAEDDDFLDEPAFTLGAQIIESDSWDVPEQIEFGAYKLQKLLGRGGMGSVYLAEDTRLGRSVALKLLPRNFGEESEAVMRFKQEARAASNISHRNIAHIYEFGSAEGRFFLAMEYVRGRSFREIIREGGISMYGAIDYVTQIACALTAAHRAGIIHRDIKPENILVDQENLVKVLDFGLAKFLGPDASRVQNGNSLESSPGLIMGTTSYMSPEQIRGLPLDERTDVWSTGVILYELLAQKRPFVGDTPSDCSASILTSLPADLSSVIGEVPDDLRRIIDRCLEKERDERYPTAEELLADLKVLQRALDRRHALDARRGSKTVSPQRGRSAPLAKETDRNKAASAALRMPYIAWRQVGPVLSLMAVMTSLAVGFYLYSRSQKEVPSSIAVLPFVNASPDPQAEYLSEGISESLINILSQLPEVKVIARNSAFKFKGADQDLRQVGQTLGVDKIITGTITPRGDDYSISVELINVNDGTQLWGEQYNRKSTDLLHVQSEISREIAGKLKVRFSGSQEQRLAKREALDPKAYECLLKGRFYWNKAGNENRKKSLEFTKEAIALDPNYAPAYADLSIGLTLLASNGVITPDKSDVVALRAAFKALELDSNLAEAHLALAWIRLNEWDWAESDREYKRAVELNPNLARAHDGYAYCLSFLGRHDEAIEETRKAKALDPISLVVAANAGNVRYLARQYDEALSELNNAMELDQSFAPTYVYFGYVYAAKGMYPEAIASYQKAIALGGNTPSRSIFLGAALARAGKVGQARRILKQLEMGADKPSPCELAILYAALGDRDRAVTLVEKGFNAHDLQLQYIAVDPAFDPLRSDPRFQHIVAQVRGT